MSDATSNLAKMSNPNTKTFDEIAKKAAEAAEKKAMESSKLKVWYQIKDGKGITKQ